MCTFITPAPPKKCFLFTQGLEMIILKHLVCLVLTATLSTAYMSLPTSPSNPDRRIFAWICCCTLLWWLFIWGSIVQVLEYLKLKLTGPEMSWNSSCYSKIMRCLFPTIAVYYVAITWCFCAFITVVIVDWIPMFVGHWSHWIFVLGLS